MRIMHICLLLALASCVPGPRPTQQVNSVVDGLPHVLAGTVALVEGGRPFCAGAVVGGHVVTAAHCVDGQEPYTLHRYDFLGGFVRPGVTGKVIYFNQEQDLAIVRPSTLFKHSLPVHPTPIVGLGKRVVVIGHPGGLSYTITAGIVSHNNRVGVAFSPMMRWLQVSAAVAPGNSGGPVVDSSGRLLGVVSFYNSIHHNYAGVTHPSVTRDALIRAGLLTTSTPPKENKQ